MAYGIKVLSANGAVQLDSTDTNQILYQEYTSGTSDAATNTGSGDFRQITVSVSGFSAGECLVFIRPTGTVTGVKAYVMPGSNGFSIFSDTNTSFYWYVFKRASSLSTPTGYGLVVYSEAVSGGSFVVDTNYTIVSSGTTSFTSIGAANNNVGTVFTATGAGSGSGIAHTVQYNSDVLSARIKGRLTGVGTVTGSNLFGMGTFQYTFANARLSPNRGFIKGFHWHWTSTGLEFINGTISPFGASYTNSDNQQTREDMFYFNISQPTALVIQAPNP
tara:strand:+ start:1010 stop:1834 length:825 start_codon:yes stop_codon:yes gene_type:complete